MQSSPPAQKHEDPQSGVRWSFKEANRLWGLYHKGKITFIQLCFELERLPE